MANDLRLIGYAEFADGLIVPVFNRGMGDLIISNEYRDFVQVGGWSEQAGQHFIITSVPNRTLAYFEFTARVQTIVFPQPAELIALHSAATAPNFPSVRQASPVGV